MKRETLATLGSVGSAAASSACCWLPLLMIATGFSVAGASTFFESYRPLFLIVAAVLLGIGFYLNYRPQKTACGPDGECTTSNIRLRGLNRGMLWTSAALVAALALFPSYAGRILGASSTSAETAETRFIVLDIEGMTCAGCEVAVATSLSELPEVVSAEVSYEDGQAVVQLAGGATLDRMALTAAVGKAGYTLASVSEAEAEPTPGLTGHWTTEVQNGEGETLEITMDLGRINSHWVGEFDPLRYKVTNYPIEVSSVEPTITLYLTAMGMAFDPHTSYMSPNSYKNFLISMSLKLDGIGAAFVWAFSVSLGIFLAIKYTVGLRVSEAEEMGGLDVTEHGMHAYPAHLITEGHAGTPLAPGLASMATSQATSPLAHPSPEGA